MSDKEYDIKIEGKENTFGDGAIRYTKDKGRFDLIQPTVVHRIINSIEREKNFKITPMYTIHYLFDDNYIDAIINIVVLKYSNHFNDLMNEPFKQVTIDSNEIMRYFIMMLKDLSIHFQKGAEKYGERNCEKGIPLWSFKDSAVRHFLQFLLSETDEPHHISSIWNCWMALWTISTHPERCKSNFETEPREVSVENNN